MTNISDISSKTLKEVAASWMKESYGIDNSFVNENNLTRGPELNHNIDLSQQTEIERDKNINIEEEILNNIGKELTSDDLIKALKLGKTISDLQNDISKKLGIEKSMDLSQEISERPPQKPVELAIGTGIGYKMVGESLSDPEPEPKLDTKDLDGLSKIINAFKEYEMGQDMSQSKNGNLTPPSTPNAKEASTERSR